MATDEILPPWTADATSASGQVLEFRLWALLTEQSRGRLHVFLPLADRGIDALVHRLTDDAYIPVQAKGRSSLMDGEVHLVVWASSLSDDSALLVSGLLVEGGLGPTMLFVPERDFKRLAELSTWDGRPVYSMGFGMSPRSNSRWLPFLVPTEQLVERFASAWRKPPRLRRLPRRARFGGASWGSWASQRWSVYSPRMATSTCFARFRTSRRPSWCCGT